MLHDGHQLDMRVAHVLHVLDKVCRQFAVGERLPVLVLPPGTQVHFIDGDGLSEIRALAR